MNFEKTILPLRTELISAALRITRNVAAAEDIVQDAMIRMLNAWGRFDGTNPRAWAHTITRNLAVNNYHRECKHSGAITHAGDVVTSNTHSKTESAVRVEFSQEVTIAMGSIPEGFSELIEAHLAGASYAQIAAARGLPIGTVMSGIHRGRKLLRVQLEVYAKNAGVVKTKRRRVGVKV